MVFLQDEMINEMARKQKQKMAEAQRKTVYRPSDGGGFVGVSALINNPNPSNAR